ncbi:MAG: DUF5335 family protein [Thermoanaerobaculia bacterium]
MEREIPQQEWGRFFEDFTMQHDSWLVTAERARGNSMCDFEELPLEGITARVDPPQHNEIVVTVGKRPERHTRLVVPNPTTVRVDQESGIDHSVEIETRSGQLTRLTFRTGESIEAGTEIRPEE